jgi:succinoglycan biosynthesis transport protein ExoP
VRDVARFNGPAPPHDSRGSLSSLFPAEDPSVPATELWALVAKGWRLIVFCTLAGVVGGVLLTLFAEPQYRATVVLNVDHDANHLFEVSDSQVAIYDPAFLVTQTRLMRSREVAERVIARLDLLGNPEVAVRRSGFFRLLDDVTPGGSRDVAAAANRIQAAVKATIVPQSNLVELTYIGHSPKASADIANALAESYIEWSMESKFQVVGQASKFLNTEIEQLKSEVSSKEDALHSYGLQKDIISVDPGTNVTLQKLEALNKDYSNAVSDRVAKGAHYSELLSAPDEAILQGTGEIASVATLKAELSTLQRSYNEKLQVYKPEWPAMKQLRAQLEELQKSLAREIHAAAARVREEAHRDLQTAQRREQSLQTEMTSQRHEAIQLNSNAIEFNNLRNDVETSRNLLEVLQKRQAETGVTARLGGQRISNIRIVDRALVPGRPFSPSYPANVWTGLFCGLVVGLSMAFLRDILDRSLRTIEDVERYIRLPALGVIPAVGAGAANRHWYGYGYSRKKKQKNADPGEAMIELLPHTHSRSAAAEAYRAVRAALLLSQAGGIRSIVVTSCLPAEGKTSTVLNLAVVLAQLDKRVLLVDADLHKPRLHDTLRIPNRVGLVSILVENVSPTLAIQTTQIPGVSVVVSGPPTPNPSGLLSSDSMRTLLEFAEMNFDYVLIDSPPLESVADAMLIGSQTDGVVLCVEGGSTSRDRVARIRNMLAKSNVPVIGVIINKLREPAFGYGYGKSYRYYSPGYGTEARAPADDRAQNG